MSTKLKWKMIVVKEKFRSLLQRLQTELPKLKVRSLLNMFKSIHTLVRTSMRCSKTNIEQIRSTFILRRKNAVRLSKMGAETPRKLRRRDYYYLLVEDTNKRKLPPVDLVLLKNVKGVGNAGDTIQVGAIRAYEHFILTGAATFATPENLEKYASLKKADAISIDIQNLLTKLNQTPVPVFLHETNEWTLQPWHIRLSLRKIGIICNEECIKIPEKTISGPDIDLEKKDFPITIVVNQKYNVMMRCRIFHLTFLETNFHIAFNPKFYMDPIKAIFPEDQSVLEKIPLPQCDKDMEIIIFD